jgi:transcription termination factor Rho
MNEEIENQPAPRETESVPAEQRQHRPRRRYPRRRYRDRGDRFGGDNSGESPNSSAVVDTNSVGAGVETLDRSASGGREGAEGVIENGEQVQAEPEFGEGIIEVSGKGFGFLRDSKRNFVQTPQDIFVTPEIVRRFALRDGMWIQGETRRGSRGPQLIKLLQINARP